MNAVLTLMFPTGRVLVGWWRLLAGQRPLALWVGYLFLHRLEAAVGLRLHGPVDALTRSLLQAIALEDSTTALLPRLQARLFLEPALLLRLLRALVAEGLLTHASETVWRLTPSGQQALQSGEFARSHQERRVFHFVEPLTPSAERAAHFVALTGAGAHPWTPGADWEFEVAALHECVQLSAEWKERYGFPPEVVEVVGAAPRLDWRQVIVDRPERLLAVLLKVMTPAGPQLQAYAARPEGWTLQAAAPALVVRGRWSEAFPELDEEPTAEQWQQAWQTWCESRGIAAAEAEACVLKPGGERVRVRVSPALLEHLRTTRSEVFKGEAWLLLGEDPVRRAAQLELYTPEEG